MRPTSNQIILMWIAFSAIYTLIGYYTNNYIITDNIYHNTFSEQLSFEHIEKILSIQKENRWVSYILLPVLIFLKMLIISGCIYTALFLYDVKISFNKVLQVTYSAEIVFVIAGLFRIVLIEYIYTPETLQQLQQFAPLSVYSLFNPTVIPSWFSYPLQLLNLFELIYIVLLGYFLSKELHNTISKSLLFIFSGYGTGLFIWCIVVTFIQLQLL